MLRSVVICPDEQLARDFECAVDRTGDASVQKTLLAYPTAIELVRTIRAHAPKVIFLSFESISHARAAADLIEAESHLPVVAIHRRYDDAAMREGMRIGIREFIAQPFEQPALRESLARVAEQIKREPPDPGDTHQIFSFLPSKAGVGASTIALNVSGAMSQIPDMRVLLSDFDLTSGMISFLLKLRNEHSVADAVENSLRMDENLWPQMVTTSGNLHVLHAGGLNPNLRIDNIQIRSLIAFMRHQYQAMCFDLSGNLEKYSIEIMQESKRVLMVCTAEKSSLLLARDKIDFLRTVDLEDRIAVVLNRGQKKPLFTLAEVEDMLRRPVLQVISNDYHGVNRATKQGSWMPPDSELGGEFSQFANLLLDRKALEKTPRNSLREFFGLSPASLPVFPR